MSESCTIRKLREGSASDCNGGLDHKTSPIRRRISDVGAGLVILALTSFCLCGFGPSRTVPHRNSAPDTSCGNIRWSVDTIGADGSTLFDCCVVSDSLAYAVGWIMPHDSAAQSHSLDWYNTAVWNGSKWTLMQVPVYFNNRKTFSPIHSVFARSSNDVWFGMYYMVHWNGRKYSQSDPYPRSFENKIWENAGGSIVYTIGDYGMISYSPDRGKSWEPVRTGTPLQFRDIWGDGGQVLAIASNNGGKECLVSLQGGSAVRLNDNFPFVRSLTGVWFARNESYFLVGNGIYETKSLKSKTWRFDPFIWHLNRYEAAVRGDSANDVFIAGEGGSIAHWNGAAWRSYHSIQNAPDQLRAVSLKGNLVVAVGQRYYNNLRNCGVIYMGFRHRASLDNGVPRGDHGVQGDRGNLVHDIAGPSVNRSGKEQR